MNPGYADFNPSLAHPTREKFLGELGTRLGMSPPEPVTVPLEHDTTDHNTPKAMKSTTIYRFNYDEQLLRILNNPHLMQMSNMVVNKDNPFSRYIPNEYLQEVQDGWVYQSLLDLVQHEIEKEHDKFFVVGHLIYVDKTHTDLKGRFCLEPVVAYLTILNRETRAKFESQILLGYINDLDLSSSAYKKSNNTKKNRGRSCRNWHTMMEKLLDPILDRQHFTTEPGGYNKLLRARIVIDDPSRQKPWDEVRRIYPTVLCILADGKGQDNNVGRFASHHHNNARGCWQCTVAPKDFTKPYQWKYLNWEDILNKSEIASVINPGASAQEEKNAATAYLHDISQYVVKNAFRHGSLLTPSAFGLSGACAVDMLHTILEGIMSYLVISFFSRLNPKVKKQLDNIVVEIMRSNSQSINATGQLPRMNFTFGVSNCTRLTAEEWHGMILCCVIILQSQRGKDLLHEPLEKSEIKINRRRKEVESIKKKEKEKREKKAANDKRKRSRQENDEDDNMVDDDLPASNDDNEAYDFNDSWTAACDDKSIVIATNWSDMAETSVINKYLCAFELMLTFEAWTKKKDGYWESSTKAQRDSWNGTEGTDPNDFPKPVGQIEAEDAIGKLTSLITTTGIPRLSLKGQYMKAQWDLPKLHWAQHYPKNITLYGALLNQDCEIGEHGHTYHGKCIARTARKRFAEFPYQCALRKNDQMIIAAARLKIEEHLLRCKPIPSVPAIDSVAIPQNATRFLIELKDWKENTEASGKGFWNVVCAQSLSKSFNNMHLEQYLSRFLGTFFDRESCSHLVPSSDNNDNHTVSSDEDHSGDINSMKIKCVTEVLCGNPRLDRLRGHWNYQSSGCRANDWVLVHVDNLQHATKNAKEYVCHQQNITRGSLPEGTFPIERDTNDHILSDWSKLGGPTNRRRNSRSVYNPGDCEDHRNKFVPCQVMFFCYMPQQDPHCASPHVVLRPSDWTRVQHDKKWDTVLFTRWRKHYNKDGRPTFVIMPLSALLERVYVAEDDPVLYHQDALESWAGTRPDAATSRQRPRKDEVPDYCYVMHPPRLWAGEFV